MKNRWKRIIAMLLAVLMVGGAAPIGALAQIDWPTLPDGMAANWWNERVRAFRSVLQLLGERSDGLSLQASAEVYSGQCGAEGNNATWEFDTATGTLTVSGTGRIRYSSNSSGNNPKAAWSKYSSVITSAVFSDGITNVLGLHDCKNLVSVSLPDSVTEISGDCFWNCESLRQITIPKNVEGDLDGLTFLGCTQLNRIMVDPNNPFYSNDMDGALFNKDKTVIIRFPLGSAKWNYVINNGVAEIGERCFENCKSLEHIEIPDTVEKIGELAFSGCSKLEDIAIPDSVMSKGWYWFEDCTSLTQVSLGKEFIPNISFDSVFRRCSNLQSIQISSENQKYSSDENGVVYNKDQTMLVYYPRGKTETEVIVRDGVQIIGTYAIKDVGAMESLILPAGVVMIYLESIQNNPNLYEVFLPSSLKDIGPRTFKNCPSLKDVYYSGSQDQWRKISISHEGNDLESATIHYDWDIEIGDPSVLTLRSTFPGKGSTNVSYEDSLILSFNQDVKCRIGLIDETYDDEIAVKNYYTDKTVFSSKAIQKTFWNRVKLAGNKLTIPGALVNLQPNQKYYLYIGPHCFTAKNDSSIHFPGITDKNAYTFTCAKGVPFVIKQTNVPMDIYNDDGDKDKKTGRTEVSFDPACFNRSSYQYNDALADFCAQFAMLGYCYDESRMEDYLTRLGFSDVQTEMHASRDQVNYFITRGWIQTEEKRYMLVFAGCIGSYRDQWYSNFDPEGRDREGSKTRDNDSEKGSIHLGFADARDFVYGKLRDYIYNLALPRDQIKLLLTGHSRGAAAVNLLAAKILDSENTCFPEKNDLYAYTFATPNAVTKTRIEDVEIADPNRYNGIFNIVNPEDFVTHVMLRDWGFHRYGTTYVLPSKTNDKDYSAYYLQRMNHYFLEFTGKEYEPYTDGESATFDIIQKLKQNVHDLDDFYNKDFYFYAFTYEKPFDFFKWTLLPFISKKDRESAVENIFDVVTDFFSDFYKSILMYFLKTDWLDTDLNFDVWLAGDFAQAHLMETYCAYMQAMNKEELVDLSPVRARTPLFRFNFPVGVDIIDKESGEVVGRIRNNVVAEEIIAKPNSVVMTVDGDSKCAWLPANGSYDVRIIGNGTGSMDCAVSTVGADGTETARANFFDVAVTPGLTMDCAVPENTFTPESATLTLADGTTILPETLPETDLNVLEIRVTTDGQGIANGLRNITKGDYVTMNAIPADDDNEFLGWYENGALVSEDANYSFVVKANRDLTAKFTNNIAFRSFTVNPGIKSGLHYGETITLHVEGDPLPAGTRVKWVSNILTITPSADTLSCTVLCDAFGLCSVAAYVICEDGTNWKDAEGTERSDSAFLGVNLPELTIRDYEQTKQIVYRSDISFTAEVQDAPADAQVHWFADGKDVYTGKTYTLKTVRKNVQICAKLIYGGVVLRETEPVSVTTRYTFWQYLILIFLFGWIWY